MTSTLNTETAASTTFSAWSCTVRLTVADRSVLAPAAMELVALLADIGRQASRFDPDSELSRANRRAGRPMPISRRLADYVAVALDAARDTDGVVDPTIGRDLIAAGYDRDIVEVRGLDRPSRPQLAMSRRRTWRDVKLDRRMALLTVPVGTALDLGATAKAHTADLAAAQLAERYECGVLVEIGGDLAVAGARRDGWVVDVSERSGDPGQRVALHRGGLATSTTTVRRWSQDGRPRHHIIDPATGVPSTGRWRSATVAGDSALAANTGSTAAIVLDDRAEGWLTAHGLAARLVDIDGRVHTVGWWPADQHRHSSAA